MASTTPPRRPRGSPRPHPTLDPDALDLLAAELEERGNPGRAASLRWEAAALRMAHGPQLAAAS